MATTKRTYGDRCGVARALDIVGERWALLVVRELLLGPKRFTDLRAGLPHVGPDILAQRLRELEASGVVRRGTLPPPAGSRIYELTERGQRARAGRPRARALRQHRLPSRRARPQIGVDALVIALKTLFAPSAADGLSASYELRLGEQHFHLRVADGRLDGRPRERPRRPTRPSRPTPATLATVLWHGRDARRGAPLGRPGRHRRRSGGHAPAGPLPAALLTLQSCRRARRRGRQSA